MKFNISKFRRALFRLGKALTLATLLPGLADMARAQSQAECYNGNDPGYYCLVPKPCDCEDGVTYELEWFPSGYPCPEGSINPINIASSDVQRTVNDLEVFGGVGAHRLAWTRYGHSRLVSDSRAFGDGHLWRHSYQWSISSPSTGKIRITEPTGTAYTYSLSGSVWTSLATNPNRLTQAGNDYWLLRQDGYTYHFQKITAGAEVYYQMVDFKDTYGATYAFTYDASRRLVLVSEPAGRWLRMTYADVPVDSQPFSLLAYATNNPPEAVWTEVTVTNPQAFRYLRYYSNDAGAKETFCNIAEIEFYDTAGVLLTGTPFGSSPSWNNNPAVVFSKAFDGNTATFFDNASRHFGFTGIDLGAGNEKVIGKVRFYPRTGYATRINGTNSEGFPRGCRFEGANVAPVTQPVISKVEAGYGSGAGEVVTRTVNYNYTAKPDAVLQAPWLTLTGVSYGDGTQAVYTYQSLWAGQRPLLATADDPRVAGRATKIRYEFWLNSGVYGACLAEHNPVTNHLLAKLEGDGAGKRKVTDARGQIVRMELATEHRPKSHTDALMRTTAYTYGTTGAGFLTATTDPLMRTTGFTRDTQGRLLTVTHPDGTTRTWTRDSAGKVLTQTDELGRVLTLTRDASHRVTRVDHPDATFETYTYNVFNQVLTHGLRNGGVESFAYDARGRLTARMDALGKTSTIAYNAQDLPVTITDALTRTRTLAYNERGQVTGVTHPDTTTAGYLYDAYGNRTSATDEAGKSWSWQFDEFKRTVSATDPLNRTTLYSYDDPSGGGCCGGGADAGQYQPVSITLPSGKVKRCVYDGAWQKTGETMGFGTPAAATTQYAYLLDGSLQTVTDPLGKVWTASYDSRRRIASVSDPLGHATAWAYDAVGNALTMTWPDATATTATYDALNRVLTSTDPKGQTVTLTYNETARLVTLTDARGKNTVFESDLRGQRVQKIYHDGSHENWSYDDVGKVALYSTVVPGGSNLEPRTLTITRDLRDRPTLLDWSDTTPDVTASYDSRGRLTTLASSVSALTYTYDDARQLLGETQDLQSPVDLPAKTVGYSYDADGNRASLTYPGGTALTYGYTARNQLAEVSADGPPPLATYSYDLAGRRTGKVLENGTGTTYGYDLANRLTGLTHSNGAGLLQSFAYGLNAVGNRTSRSEETEGTSFTDVYEYDAIDQVTQVKYRHHPPTPDTPVFTARQVDYAYDAAGNRQTVTEDADGIGPATAQTRTYQVNDLNQYTGLGGGLVLPTYDIDGNLTHAAFPNGSASWDYTYDAQNRLTGGTDGLGTAFSFTYDARNRCVARTISGTTTLNYYDEWSLIEERTPTDALTAKHVHGANLDEILCTIRNVSGSSATNYHHHDGLGSVTALTGATGSLVESYTYDIYGAPTVFDSSFTVQSGSSVGNRFLFTGREWLAAIRLQDNRHRYYQPEMGRWLSRDPIEEEGGMNLNRYVENSPTNAIDPVGLQSWVDMKSLPNYTGPSTLNPAPMPPGTLSLLGSVGGMICEPLDWVMTGVEICNDPKNPFSYAGLIPIVPSGAGKLCKKAAQWIPLSPGEIKKLKKAGHDPHDLKPNSKFDLFKDEKGNIFVKPKNGCGPGDPTGININNP